MAPPRRWVLTRHALTRAYEMGLDRDAVVSILSDPDTDYPSQNPGENDCRVATCGSIAVVYNPVQALIVTVLIHGEDYNRRKIPPTKAVKQLRRAAAKRKDRS